MAIFAPDNQCPSRFPPRVLIIWQNIGMGEKSMPQQGSLKKGLRQQAFGSSRQPARSQVTKSGIKFDFPKIKKELVFLFFHGAIPKPI